MRGLPGHRERRRQHRRTPSRCQRSTVAGLISTSASRQRGHNRRKNSQRRSAGRKCLFERAMTPSWWRRARISSRRSRRVARADRTAAPVLMTARIACRVPAGNANVKEFWPYAILFVQTLPDEAEAWKRAVTTTGRRRKSNVVTMPKFPPPPRRPQNRSSCSVALALRNRPSAVTTSADTRLSHESPPTPISHPSPPPSVRPATPVFETVPHAMRGLACDRETELLDGPARFPHSK
jgi:hypothetical protein